jgi:hypothetical protein
MLRVGLRMLPLAVAEVEIGLVQLLLEYRLHRFLLGGDRMDVESFKF